MRLARLLPVLALFAALSVAPASAADSTAVAGPDTSRTLVFVVRHAEKSTTVIGADPPLSEGGRRRAGALAQVLQDANVRTVYVTKFARTRQTADSLVARTGAEVRVADQGDAPALARRVLEENTGRSVLIVGHSDTVPAIVAALCGEIVPPFREGEFDVLYVVTVPREGIASAVRLHYGAQFGAR
jgi:phosphohistidine phosphatase SixA